MSMLRSGSAALLLALTGLAGCASVDAREDGIYTTTSRAFAVVGVADSITEAEGIVAETLAQAGTDGLRVRHDIGTSALVQSRIEHMNELRGTAD